MSNASITKTDEGRSHDLGNLFVFLAQSVPDGRVFALDRQTLISMGIMVLNGIILAVALYFILYKPVTEFLQKRSERIRNSIEEASSTMAKARELINEYESKVSNIDKEYERVLQEARIKAYDERKIIIAEAHEEAERIKKRSESIIDAERERMRLETRPYIIELATLIAENYITRNIEKEEQERLFESALAELEEAQWRK